jgi:hypothetical protein
MPGQPTSPSRGPRRGNRQDLLANSEGPGEGAAVYFLVAGPWASSEGMLAHMHHVRPPELRCLFAEIIAP